MTKIWRGGRQRRSGQGRGRESAVRKHARWGESNRPSRPSPATSFSPRARGHVLVLDYIDSRAEHSSKISSGFQHLALLDVGGHPQSRYGRAYSLREDVVVTLPVTMEILSVRAVKTSCLSRALPPECWSHHSLVFSLQAGPRGELAWRCPKNGSVLPCEFGPLCLSADSTRCQDSESLVQIQIEQTVPRQIQLPCWGPLFPALGGRSHAPPLRGADVWEIVPRSRFRRKNTILNRGGALHYPLVSVSLSAD